MKITAQILIIVLLITASVTLGKNIHSQISRFKEIYETEREVGNLTGVNKDLEKELEKVKSDFNLVKEARDKLGYQKPGEVLFVVPEQEVSEEKAKEKANKIWEQWVELVMR